MKKFILLAAVAFAFSITSCKKDRECDCTTTVTGTNGHTNTNPNDNTTYKDISKGAAKNICQKSTITEVGEDGSTTTTVHDCKLK